MPPQIIAGERPLINARQHWLVLVPHMAGAVIGFIAGLILISFIPDEFAGHHVGGFRALLRLALFLALAGSAAGAWLRWRYQNYLLTDHRMVVSRGVVARVTESIALDRIQDIRVRQNLSARMINCGDVEIESAGREGTEVLAFIPLPQEFANELIRAVEAHRLAQFGPDSHLAMPGTIGAGYPARGMPGGFSAPGGSSPPGGPSAPGGPAPGTVVPQRQGPGLEPPDLMETPGDRFRRGGGPPPGARDLREPGIERPPVGPPQAPFDPSPPPPPPPEEPRQWRPRRRSGGL